MRADVVAKFAALLALVQIAGCTSAPERPTLTIWHAWGGAELTTLKALIRQYQARHPEVEVLSLQIPHDRLLDKYTRSSAANGGPDILIGDNDWSGKLAESDLVAPIFDFSGKTRAGQASGGDGMAPGGGQAPDDGEGKAGGGKGDIRPGEAVGDALFDPREASRFPREVLGALQVGERVHAWPESVETLVLYYNKRLVKRPPSTVAEMLQVASATRVPDGYGMAFNTGFYFFSGYFLGGGGRIFDAAGKVSLDTPEGRKMLAWLGTLSASPGILASNDYGKADSLYKQGKAAMILNGPWALADYQAAMGPDLGVAPLPALEAGKPAAPWIGVKCMMVNANADRRHRELARDFLLYVSEPAQQLALATGAGHIPATSGVELPPGSPLRVFQAQVRTGTPKSADPQLALIWAPMDRAVQEVTVHKHDVAEALARAQKTVEAQLAKVQDNR